jgi:hypothetical protein
MRIKISSSAFLTGFLALLVMILVVGCSARQSDELPVFAVRGMVHYNGQPMTGANIVLVPTHHDPKLRMPPFGVVGVDGSFEITSYTKGDGAPVGEYKITFTWPDGSEDPSDLLKGRLSDPKKPSGIVTIAEGDNLLPAIELSGPPIVAPPH